MERHPESYCHRCNGPNVSWTAPSPLWNAVIRNHDGPVWDEIICPTCFAVLAKERGIADGFKLEPLSYCLLVELPTTDESGRVWNPSLGDVGMWEDAPTIQ